MFLNFNINSAKNKKLIVYNLNHQKWKEELMKHYTPKCKYLEKICNEICLFYTECSFAFFKPRLQFSILVGHNFVYKLDNEKLCVLSSIEIQYPLTEIEFSLTEIVFPLTGIAFFIQIKRTSFWVLSIFNIYVVNLIV